MTWIRHGSVKIAYDHHRTGHDDVIILAHGFYNNKDTVIFKAMAKALSADFDVISFDFRGHGKSGGFFSFTSRESADLRAVVSYAASCGYSSVGVLGFSLGAAVALIESSQNRAIQSVIAVGAPYDFWKINCCFWEKEMLNDLRLNFGPKGAGKGIRPGNPFLKKIKPIDVAERISPTPVLFMHGENDWLIKPHHSRRLFEKALPPKKIRIWKKAGHAEKIYDRYPGPFLQSCTEWFQSTLRPLAVDQEGR